MSFMFLKKRRPNMFSKYFLKLPGLPTNFPRQSINKLAKVSEVNVDKNVGKRTKVQGWVRAIRKMKENIFIDVNDGSSCKNLQMVLKKDQKPENLTYGCSISAEGELAVAPNGRNELVVDNFEIHGTCDLNEYPFLPRKSYSADYVREYLHLRPRTRTFSSFLRLRDLTSFAIAEHFRNRGFVNIHTPILTSNDCEGAGEVFRVQPHSDALIKGMKKSNVQNESEAYFDSKAFLSVSGQLHLEICARSLTRVYNFSPSFRAENSKSRLHLSEFYMIEAEIAFMNSLQDLAAEAELLIKTVMRSVLEQGTEDLQILEVPEPTWLEKDFGFISYKEATTILNENANKLTFPLKPGDNLSKEHELFLVQHNGNVPVFVVEWPKDNKPFYMKECIDNPSKVLALDLLAPTVGEIIGGSVREDDWEKLRAKLPADNNLQWYLDLRKYGNVPSAGFGMGFERFLQFIFGITNIKDAIPFPRSPHNCQF